jgi:MFS family permease
MKRVTKDDGMRPIPLIGLMCLGIILTLMCYANFPALQPQFEALWCLTKMESGLIFGIFFGGVLAGTPILSPLADKFDPRRIWILASPCWHKASGRRCCFAGLPVLDFPASICRV